MFSRRVSWLLAAAVASAFSSLTFAQDCPELVGRWPYGPSYAVAVSGDYAYFGSGTVLIVADVSDPAAPQAVGEVVLPEVIEGAAAAGSYSYVANDEAGLRVIDVSTPAYPFEVGLFDTPGWALGVAVSGSFAYVADYDYGLRVIDISTPASPFEVGFFETMAASGVAVSGRCAYVAYFYGLAVIDVSDPSSPTELGYSGTPEWSESVTVSGDFAYVAEGDAGLGIFDVSGCIGFVPSPPAPRRSRGRMTP